MKLDFSRPIFEKKTQITNFMKLLAVRAQIFHAGGRADIRDEANSRKFFESA